MISLELREEIPASLNSQLSKNHLYYLDNLSVIFGKVHALGPIQLSVAHQEILFITGPSGAGKSTLLNLLAGNVNQASGRIIRPDSKNYFVSQVFQDLRLISSDTCEQALWYAYDRNSYKSKNEFNQDLLELCNFLGVKELLSRKISEANGGLKQKIAIIRAFLARPDVLIADEPTASLDKESAMKLFEVFQYFNSKKRMAIIWSSHNKEWAKDFPSRMIHLDQGKIIYAGNSCFM